MATHSYLYRRKNGTLYVRFTCPKALLPEAMQNKPDIRLSLGTTNHQEAISLAGLLRYRFTQRLDTLKAQRSTQAFANLFEALRLELKAAITCYHAEKCGMTDKKTDLPTYDPSSPKENARHTSGEVTQQSDALADTLADTLDLILKEMHPSLPRNDIEIEVDGKKVTIRHPDRPELELEHAKALLGLGGSVQEDKTPFYSVQMVFDQYIKNKFLTSTKANPATKKESAQMLKTVISLLGADTNFYTLTLDDGEVLVHQILNLKDGRAANQATASTISKVRAKKILDKFKPVAAYAKVKGYNPEDIGAHLHIHAPKNKKSDDNAVFSTEDLSKLLSGYPYTQTPLPRERELHDYHFWLLPVLMYTGARLNEICQLKVCDICKHPAAEELHYFDIKGEVKTDASVREVPVHPQLIALGFLEFVQERQTVVGPQGMLFDGLYYNAKNKWGKKASDWFNGGGKQKSYRELCQIENFDQKNLHTFRHTFINTLTNTTGVPHPVIADLAGHEFGGETSRYGKTHREAPILMESMKQLDYGVDLSHLDYAAFKAYKDKKGKV